MLRSIKIVGVMIIWFLSSSFGGENPTTDLPNKPPGNDQIISLGALGIVLILIIAVTLVVLWVIKSNNQSKETTYSNNHPMNKK